MTMLTEEARQQQLREWRKIISKELIEEGRAEERADREVIREIIYEQGNIRFGTPPAEVVQTVSAIDDLVLLTRLIRRLLNVTSWTDLLASSSE